ncbi:hypothetical protein WISP_61808 [Willisornis vidua]|uniref:Uncharacterized protein n=1 Tax=Willisornis vidua TaxID=1566151 RepID=A0ABQ9DBQ1_9PASS|nr:hypothetical protein WISP_61808 [Willisornis vidua]
MFLKLVSVTSIPGRAIMYLILEVNSKHVENKKVIVSSQLEIIKGKSRFANLTAFCNETTAWINERRAVDIVSLDFCKTFDSKAFLS